MAPAFPSSSPRLLAPFVLLVLAGSCSIVGCSAKSSGGTGASNPTFGPQVTLARNLSTIYYLASDGHDVYAATQDSIVKIPVGGGSPTTLAPISSQQEALGLAVADSQVIWSVLEYGGSQNVTSIYSVPVGGGAVSNPHTVAGFAGAFAVDGSDLYWAGVDPMGSCATPPCATLVVAPLSGGTPKVLSNNAHGATTFAFDASTVYWGTSDAHIMKVPKAGGTTTTLADYTASTVTGLGLVGSTLYWGSSSGDVFATPTAGGASKAIEVGLDSIRGAVTEDNGVYWIGTTQIGDYGVLAWTPLDGSATRNVWTLQGGDAYAMAMDDANVYVALSSGELIKQSR